MKTVRRLAAATAIAALALTSVAADGDPVAPTVSATGKTVAGVTTVSGTAAAGTPGVESVNGFVTDFAETNVSSQTGHRLTDAMISQDADGITFTWQVENLHAPAPPEGVRYTWSFLIGEASFQLQAKSTNVASITLADDPAGHVTNAGASFQVRGNCVAEYLGTPVANCPHIGWTDGAFDTANNQVTMTVPFGFHELIVPGAVIVENQTAGMSIAASYQAVANTSAISTFINDWSKPYVADLGVFLTVASKDLDIAKVKGGELLELGANGSFTGSIEVDADQQAYIRACTGFTCTTVAVG